ncbi:MAG: methyl-accepting chemotaxis protein [Pseudomonadales bacterium]|nr:methyl-accepting chemotaxis protein [Pseudomonadales bacterium]
MNFQDLSVKVKLMLAVGTPIFLMMVLGIIVFINLGNIKETGRWVTHTHKVLNSADQIITSAVDMETGMRGYLLAGKEEFLEPYESGESAKLQLIKNLRKTVNDNPPQVERLAEVENILGEWQENVTEPAISLRREIGDAKTMNDMAKLVGEAHGKKYFDKFRGQIATFIEREQKLLKQRRNEFDSAKRKILNNVGRMSRELGIMQRSERWVTHTYLVIDRANALLAAAVDMETGMRGYLLAGKEEFLEPYNQGKEQFNSILSSLKETVSDNPAQVQLLDEINQTINSWKNEITAPMISLRREIGNAKTMDDMADLVGEARGKVYFDRFRSVMSDFKKIEADLMKDREQASIATMSNTQTKILISILLSIAIGSALGFYFVRDLMNKLGGEPGDVSRIAAKVADGDLTVEFDKAVSSESVYGAMRNMTEKLRTTVSQVQDMASQLAAAAEETSVIAEQTSKSIETQLSETTQVATAMTEMSTTVTEVANNVTVAASASGEAINLAVEGKSMMTNTLAQMQTLNVDVGNTAKVIQDLEQGTKEVNSILEVIEGIAEQTNLLALNAAIEAARAGEQGRGFAVVADEVRTLAGRTQQSTTEINNMIEQLQSGAFKAVEVMNSSQNQVNSVCNQALSTESMLNNIQEAIGRINDMNTQISSSAEEQSVVAAEINRNVVRVSDLAEDTSIGAKQAAQTGQELSSLALALNDMMSRFKV